MALLFPIRRLVGAALLCAACLVLSVRMDASSDWVTSDCPCPGATAPVGLPRLDIDADGDIDRLALDHALIGRTVWENERSEALALFRIPDHLALPHLLGNALASMPSEDTDSSDPSVRTESRGGHSAAQPAGSLSATSPIAPRSRTFSSSSPRAPPVALRLV